MNRFRGGHNKRSIDSSFVGCPLQTVNSSCFLDTREHVLKMSDLEILLRLGITVVLCGLVGLERESRDQAAGLRTHVLVGVGAALFTLVSAYGFQDVVATNQSGKPIMRDPTRIAAQVVSGIGFLGAGAIMRQGFTVRGLTTAATLWMSAAIGMAAAAGFYAGAIVAAVISIAALIIFRKLRPHFMPRLRSDWVVLELDLADTKSTCKENLQFSSTIK